MQTIPSEFLACDGCGQSASPAHLARRLQRLEWTTRYRPVHISTLLLGGVSPLADEDFLYAGKFKGEAARLLEATGISTKEKSPEAVLSEFQRGGFFLTHLLECPLESGRSGQLSCEQLLVRHISSVTARIRRSLKPKRIVLISELLEPLLARLSNAELACPVLLDNGKPFGLDSSDSLAAAQHVRETLMEAASGK